MATSADEIIRSLENEFPNEEQPTLKNYSDLKIEGQVTYVYQYIIGLCRSDVMQAGVSQYEYNMKASLSGVSENITVRPWSFYDYEIEEVKQILAQLAEHFNADLNIEAMVNRLGIKKEEGRMYFIVVTILETPIFYVRQHE